MRADAFIPFQSGNLGGTDPILFYKSVLRNALLFHSYPKFFVRNHNIQAFPYLNINQIRYIITLTNIG